MKSFKNVAIESVTMSLLMVGRTAITTEEIITKYPKGITVDDFDIVDAVIEDKPAHFAVITIEEDDKVYYTSGIIITKMVDAFVEECGNIETARAEYEKDKDKLKLKLTEGKNKSGKNNLTKVEVM